MSWSFNYLKKLQSQIEKYKDRIGFLINTEKEIAAQPELIKISQELDKLIVSYQNFKKVLNESQSLPFTVDFYMNTTFCITNEIDVTASFGIVLKLVRTGTKLKLSY